jgi:hypothetical protein
MAALPTKPTSSTSLMLRQPQKVAFVTAADAIHANHIAVTKDSTVEFSIAPTKRGNRVSVIYVASATVGTYVSVILEAGA